MAAANKENLASSQDYGTSFYSGLFFVPAMSFPPSRNGHFISLAGSRDRRLSPQPIFTQQLAHILGRCTSLPNSLAITRVHEGTFRAHAETHGLRRPVQQNRQASHSTSLRRGLRPGALWRSTVPAFSLLS